MVGEETSLEIAQGWADGYAVDGIPGQAQMHHDCTEIPTEITLTVASSCKVEAFGT